MNHKDTCMIFVPMSTKAACNYGADCMWWCRLPLEGHAN